VPVPVPVPYYKPHHHHDDEFDGYDYPHPHIQYRKDIEELKEWGIEPHDEAYVDHSASGAAYSDSYGLPQYAANIKPLATSYMDSAVSGGAHNLAYSGYLNDVKYNRRPAQQPGVLPVLAAAKPSAKNPYAMFAPNMNARPAHQHHRHHQRVSIAAKSATISRQEAEDVYYGPIVARLEDIFQQLRIHEETCQQMLVCSMYKNPANYSPHSNIVSHELSR